MSNGNFTGGLSMKRLRFWRNEPDIERIEIKPITVEDIRREPLIMSHTLELFYRDGSCKRITAYVEVCDVLYCMGISNADFIRSILYSGTDETGNLVIHEYVKKLAMETQWKESHEKIQRMKDVTIHLFTVNKGHLLFFLSDGRQILVEKARVEFPFTERMWSDYQISDNGRSVFWESYDDETPDFEITLEDVLLPK